MVTDRFHKNKSKSNGKLAHQNCPSAFSLDYWKQLSDMQAWQGKSRGVNSSTAEQLNAKLRQMESHLRCCNLSNATCVMKMFMAKNNLDEKKTQ